MSVLGALGVATLAALGASAAGVDPLRPAAARVALPPMSVVDAPMPPAAARATESAARAVVKPAPPVPLPPDDRAIEPWQEAATAPGGSGTAILYPGPAAARHIPPPAPVLKPTVEARIAAADATPPVVQKPRDSGWSSVAAVIARFESVGYDLEAVRASAGPVPRLYLDALPRDLARMPTVGAKKHLFFQAVLPVILRVNEELSAARWRAERLGALLLWADALSPGDREWLVAAAELYGTEPFDVPALLSRMDVVPPSLALAQAAEETGWGTSRFVREGNALFGQYTYKSVTGMVPERRDADRRHRVRRYDNLLDAARAYVHNLNSHPAYEDFRQRRSRLRSAGEPFDGYLLAGELRHYSERRTAYVRTIRQIIRQNRLGDFDRAWLNNRQWTALTVLPGQRPI